MQRDRYAKIELRPNKATEITISPEQIHPNYKLRSEPSSLATDTGHLELFRLEPVEGERPMFSARWDLKPNTIDIDLIGDVKAGTAFKAESGGYKGHHTVVVSETPRVYLADVRTPMGIVFVGRIAVKIELGLYLRDNIGNLIDEITDGPRILAVCPHCGPVQFSGPPFVPDHCPQCTRDLRTPQPEDAEGRK